MLPHLGVHGRGDEHRRPGGEQGGGEQVVGDPRRVLPEQFGGGGRHDHEVGPLAEVGVRDRLRPAEQRRARRFRRERGERERADEPEGILGQDRGNVRAGVDETPAHLDGLVRGDATAHAEHDPPTA